MNKKLKTILTLVCFLIVILVLVVNHITDNNKMTQFKLEEGRVASFLDTTADRVSKVVITLPEGNTLVGMVNNVGHFKTDKGIDAGIVTIDNKFLVKKFIEGIYNKKDPRVDAIAPMYVNGDSHIAGSTYIVLFKDRGDVALEESYARLGSYVVTIQKISILPTEGKIKDEDYKVDVIYKLEGKDMRKASAKKDQFVSIDKEVIIPVVSGHFDPSNTISK